MHACPAGPSTLFRPPCSPAITRHLTACWRAGAGSLPAMQLLRLDRPLAFWMHGARMLFTASFLSPWTAVELAAARARAAALEAAA